MSTELGKAQAPATTDRLIDRFIPHGDVDECHETLVRAPAELLFKVATQFDLRSIPAVSGIFWLRGKLLGASKEPAWMPRGFLDETMALGWRVLAERPGREIVMGALTQPWLPDVRFEGVGPEAFAACSRPDHVKIVWTIEIEPLPAGLTRLRTRTRAQGTDEGARRKFQRYWRQFGAGILMIRWLVLPAIRREAERRYRMIRRDTVAVRPTFSRGHRS